MKTVVLSTFALALSTSLAFAAAGGGSSGGSTSTTTPPPTNSPMQMHCKTGEVVKTVKKNGKDVKACVKVSGSLLDDGDLYHQGWVLAKAGKYDWAIQVLSSVKDQSNPDVLTMLGYSNRKAGRFDVGFDFYHKALAINPDHVRAHEYLGEGLVAQGKLEDAKAQLGEVQRICGNTTCEEYQDLSKAIASGKDDEL
jgi:tetratricopeptide (TPR) repeat protein